MNPDPSSPIQRYDLEIDQAYFTDLCEADNGEYMKYADHVARLAQLAQEQAALHDLLSEINAHVDFEAGDMPELQARVDAVLTDGDHTSCRRWQELEAAEAALGETRQALQQIVQAWKAEALATTLPSEAYRQALLKCATHLDVFLSQRPA